MNFDLEALVNETFNISSKDLATEKERDSLFNFSDKKVFVAPQETVGLFYTVHKTATTYIVKSIISENLFEDYKGLLTYPENYPSLKFDFDEDIQDQLKFFECDSILFAKEIKKQICNKRFPLEEENLFNVSDYSDHWWIHESDNKIELSFKLRSQNLKAIKIEALCEVNSLVSEIKELYSYLNLIFPVSEFSIADSKLLISTKEGSERFDAFKEIFISGDAGANFWAYLKDLEERSQEKSYLNAVKRANFLLLKISSIRRFSVQVASKL